jgi:hypothetical protein
MLSERTSVLSLIKSIACSLLLISVSLCSIAAEPNKVRKASLGAKLTVMDLNGTQHLFRGVGLSKKFKSGWVAGLSMMENVNQGYGESNKMDFHFSAMTGYGGQVHGKLNYLIGAEVGYGLAQIYEYNDQGKKTELDCDCSYRLLQGVAELNYTYSKKAELALQYLLIDVDSPLIKDSGQGIAAALRFKW